MSTWTIYCRHCGYQPTFRVRCQAIAAALGHRDQTGHTCTWLPATERED